MPIFGYFFKQNKAFFLQWHKLMIFSVFLAFTILVNTFSEPANIEIMIDDNVFYEPFDKGIFSPHATPGHTRSITY